MLRRGWRWAALVGLVGLAVPGCGGDGGEPAGDAADAAGDAAEDVGPADTGGPSDVAPGDTAPGDVGGVDGDTAAPPGAVWGLSAASQAVLDEAGAAYMAQVAAGAAPGEARAALVAWLLARPEVASAALGADGRTVGVRMADGERALLDTLDHAGVREGADAALADLAAQLGTKLGPLSAPAPATATGALEGVPWVPGTGRALFLDISAPEFPRDADAIGFILDDLKARGWTEDRLDVLTRTGPNDTSISLETLRRLHEYGLVTVFAHGAWLPPSAFGDAAGVDPDAPRFYLEWMSATDYTAEVGLDTMAQWQGWVDEGRLVPMKEVTAAGGYWVLAVRDDLVDELLGTLPGTLVALAVCHGWHARDVFMDHGAGGFVGWDAAIQAKWTYRVLVPLYAFAATDLPPSSVQDVFYAPDMIRDGTDSEGQPSVAHLAAAADTTWLPAWVEVDVPADTVPEATARLELEVSFAPSGLAWKPTVSQPLSAGTTLALEPLAPQLAWITVTAFDEGGAALRRKRDTFTFLPGANWLQEPLPPEQVVPVERAYTTYTCPPVDDPPCVGVTSTRFFRWKAVEGAVRYTGVVDTAGYSGAGWSTGKTLDLMPGDISAGCFGPGTGKCASNQCYLDRDKVLACFGGADPWGMAPDDLVHYIPFGSTCTTFDPTDPGWLDNCLTNPSYDFAGKDAAGAAATEGWTLAVVPF